MALRPECVCVTPRMLIEVPTCSPFVLVFPAVTHWASPVFQKLSLALGKEKNVTPSPQAFITRGRLGEMYLLNIFFFSHCIMPICGRKCGWHYLGSSTWWGTVSCLEAWFKVVKSTCGWNLMPASLERQSISGEIRFVCTLKILHGKNPHEARGTVLSSWGAARMRMGLISGFCFLRQRKKDTSSS